MSKSVIQTQAGDDSDGKVWGVEGLNIVIILVGLIISIGLTLLLFRLPSGASASSFIVGAIPFGTVVLYTFGLRQGRPKAYDTDLLETMISGTGWKPSSKQTPHPLYLHERP